MLAVLAASLSLTMSAQTTLKKVYNEDIDPMAHIITKQNPITRLVEKEIYPYSFHYTN